MTLRVLSKLDLQKKDYIMLYHGNSRLQLADINRQLADGRLTEKHLQSLLEGRNPFQAEAQPCRDTLHLRYVGNLRMHSTLGTTTIMNARKVFAELNWSAISDFGKKTNVDTLTTQLALFDVKKSDNSKVLFESLALGHKLWWLTEGQVVRFCQKHTDQLSQNGYTLFPFFYGSRKLIAAVETRPENGLYIRIFPYTKSGLWRNIGRIVVLA
jgi:hypothetical protein